MIDIHTHILPHIDDGAKDTATAREMLKMQSEQGVKTIVSTSHYYGRKHSPQRFLEKRSEAFARIKDALPQDMEVRLGAEVHFTGVNMPEADKLCLLAIEKTKYILMELPFTTKWSGGILHKLADFVYETGYTPIIAHVERYDEVLKKPSIVNDFVDMGCLIQVNAPAFLDKREKKLAFAMLKRGFVHCIGSDAHDLEGRASDFPAAKAAVERAGYADAWKRAEEIMTDVLADKPVRLDGGKPLKKIFGLYV
jgi:protein-tyrosine phosphatase